MLPKRRRFLFAIPFFVAAALFIFGMVVMLLWNAILPDVLGVRTITYWQALGLLALCKILFGSFGAGRGYRGGPPWKKKLMEMTPEERERFKQQWQQRWTDPGKEDLNKP
jgi:hypothetical protein